MAGRVTPLVVAAELAPPDLAWLDELRRRHYPAERNRLPAHLTMFHALPPSAEGEAAARLARLAGGPAPRAEVAGLMDLGGGGGVRRPHLFSAGDYRVQPGVQSRVPSDCQG